MISFYKITILVLLIIVELSFAGTPPGTGTGPGATPSGPSSPQTPGGVTSPSAPTSPTGPNVPSGPTSPTVPDGPTSPTVPGGVPTAPTSPGGPTNPTVPNTPTTPGGPTNPTVPNTPTTPGGPTNPTVPNTPTTPGGPTNPTVPSTPTTPGSPTNPTVPNTPTTPGGPTNPTVPSTPTGPGGPTNPTVPNTPTTPGGPTNPTVPNTPTTPGGPTNPTVPNVPTSPGGPTNPTVPSTPTGPGGPTNPTVPNTPTTPGGPTNPTVPSTPTTPGGPTNPTGGNTPGGPPDVPVFATRQPGQPGITRQPMSPNNVPAPTFPGGLRPCTGTGQCETPQGEVGECVQEECLPLCQDQAGMNCGQYAGQCERQSAQITAACCKTCSLAAGNNECSNTAIGGSCVINHMHGTCTANGCVSSTSQCGGQVCTAPACHSPTCALNACGVTKLPDGTNCGGINECYDGSCLLPGGGAAGGSCVFSSDCTAITEECRDSACHYGRCVAAFVSNSLRRTCGQMREGTCVDGRCEGSTAECMNLVDNTPCADGRCVGGICQSTYCPEGGSCMTSTNVPGVCRSGNCEETGPCSRYDMCSGCQSVRHTDGVTWTSLRIACTYDNYYGECYGDSGPCRVQLPTTTNTGTQPVWGGTNSVYGTPPPTVQQQEGVQWKIRRSLLSSTEADAGLCIDNNATSECSSLAGKNQWLQFQLGMILPVGVIKIRNSPSWCGQRMVCGERCGNVTCASNPGFEIRVGTQPCVVGSTCNVNPICATYSDNTGETPTTTVICRPAAEQATDRKGSVQQSSDVFGNYMQVVLVDAGSTTDNRKLNMAEGEVYAPVGWTPERAAASGYGSEVGANSAVATPPPYVQSSLKPPTQASTDKSSVVVVILIAVSLLFCICVALYLRFVRKERWWFIRSIMFAAGILRVFDWVSDVLFFLFLSAIEDLGEVNNYSIACMIIIVVNLSVECMRLGWAILGRFKHEPFFWVGSLVVLVFQIPGFLLCEPSRLSTYTYDSRMRDRWDWVTHMSEDVPQITLAIIYGSMRSFSATSILTLSVSCAALLGSAILKFRRKYMRMEFTERALEMAELKANTDCTIRAPHPVGMPTLNWIEPKRKLAPSEELTDGSYSYSYAPEKGEYSSTSYDYTYDSSSLPAPHKSLYPEYEVKGSRPPKSQFLYPESVAH